MLKIGSLIDGKYRVLSEIGHGGMSVVYMAINEKANKTWAIKEVRKDGIKDFEVVRQGLIVETEMLKRLSHPNLPSIVDVIESDDTFLIVMDYIEGNPLSQSLEEFGAQPQDYVIDWAKQLCDVLEYLHTRTPAIIYRDMKPANIMLKPDGNITLIDFGTAREFKEKNLADTTCLGTVGYAAPEQFGGMGQTDARTDIYCLGATLYHLVTGCNPCEPPYEILPIRSINPQLSSGLERIIIKCTQRNPDDRYQSCAELMYALDHYEEIDDKYRREQKKKLRIFLSSVIMMFAALIGAFISIGVNNKQIEKKYKELLSNGVRLSESYEYREENLISAIETNYNEAYDAIDNLLELYIGTGSDNLLSPQEFNNIKIIDSYIPSLKSNEEKARICYKIACNIFQYYSNDGKESNSIIGSDKARQWFKNSKDYAAKSNMSLLEEKGYSQKNIDILMNLGDFSEILENSKGLQEENERLDGEKNDKQNTIDTCWKYLSGGFLDDIKNPNVQPLYKRMICKYGSFMLYSNTVSMQKSLGENYSYEKVIMAYNEMINYLKSDDNEQAKNILESVKILKEQFEYANRESDA
ncbi:MAG: serine/threonine protein kinase [Clostridiales bacterium]|nr:serine/threonine protein kinase [Clostridiales bacterium]